MTPMAAASVAVAKPRYMDPITTVISAKTGSKKRELRSFSPKLIPVSASGFQSFDNMLVTAT